MSAEEAGQQRRTYLLVDGENIDATLGGILQHRPTPDDRPRWERLLDDLRRRSDRPVTGLFFLNASSGSLPLPFVQALTAIGYRPIPLASPPAVKIVDVGIQRTLDAIVGRDADVALASHDVDYLPNGERLLERADRQVTLVGFVEYFNSAYSPLRSSGRLSTIDLEIDAGVFTRQLPRVRIIALDDFDPEQYLN